MAEYNRTAEAVWKGDLRAGKGEITSGSGAINGANYSYSTRFENGQGTNPEELLAAAAASCYSMALASTLSKNGFQPVQVSTQATCTIVQQESGWQITGIRLEVHGEVPGIDESRFQELAKQTDQTCPVSSAFHRGIGTQVEAYLK